MGQPPTDPPRDTFQNLRPRSRVILLGLLVVFVVALTTRTYGLNTASAWAWWIGDTLLRLDIFAAGAIVLVSSLIDPQFPFEMAFSRRGTIPNPMRERFKWAVMGLAASGIGLLLVINGVRQMLSGCGAPAC